MPRILIPNYEFVESWSEDQLNNFVTTPSGLPHEIMGIVRRIYSEVNTIRLIATINNPNLEKLDQEERAETYNLSFDDAREYHIDYALDFLEKYPQFKPIIKGVKEV